MADITLKGNPVHTSGELPPIGSKAPNATLVDTQLSSVSLDQFWGKQVVLNIFPSVDTSTCAMSVRKFNAEAGSKENTVVLCISKDLPFALSRFCGAEGLENVIALSDFRGDFVKYYSVLITDGVLAGLLSRCVIVIGKEGNVVYTEQVSEITQEPNYEAALKSLEV